MDIQSTIYGDVTLVTLENDDLKVVLTNYGAAIFHIYIKQDGKLKEVSVQPNDMNEFLSSSFYYGKTIGRTAGRLFLPSYDIGDQTYFLPDEKKVSFIHGGPEGFSFKHFDILSYSQHDVTFKATSYEDEGPYDGDMTLEVRYHIEGDALAIHFKAETTKTSLCNITNHVYLNLSDDINIYDHEILIHADTYLNIDQDNRVISIDSIQPPFDMNRMQPIKPLLDHMAQTPFDGFDHTFLLSKKEPVDMVVRSKDVMLEVKTSYPSIVLYTHNNLAPYDLRGQKPLENKHIGFTVECQFEPGGIQVDTLHDAILHPGDIYEHDMVLTFKKR